MNEINRELKKLCKGTDKKLQQLKHKYAGDAAVTGVLASFEPNIEPAPRRRTY
jgi:DNA polymerase I-like protein with 3'-5' exonuclease and polymerase domains